VFPLNFSCYVSSGSPVEPSYCRAFAKSESINRGETGGKRQANFGVFIIFTASPISISTGITVTELEEAFMIFP
jgi:hypothetical protein